MTQYCNVRFRGEKTCSIILLILSSYNVTPTAHVQTAASTGVAVSQHKQQGKHLEILSLRNT